MGTAPAEGQALWPVLLTSTSQPLNPTSPRLPVACTRALAKTGPFCSLRTRTHVSQLEGRTLPSEPASSAAVPRRRHVPGSPWHGEHVAQATPLHLAAVSPSPRPWNAREPRAHAPVHELAADTSAARSTHMPSRPRAAAHHGRDLRPFARCCLVAAFGLASLAYSSPSFPRTSHDTGR